MEFFNIIYIFFVLIFVFTFYFSKNRKIDIIQLIGFNVIVLSSIFLLLSFFKISIFLIFYLLIFFRICNIFFITKKNDSLLNFKASFLNIKFIFIFFIFFALSIFLSNNIELSWDAQNYNILKVYHFYNEEDFFGLTSLPAAHYPHLGQYFWAFFWKISLFNNEYSGRLFFIFINIFSIFFIFELIKNNNFYKIIFSLFCIILTFSKTIYSGGLEILSFSYLSFLSFFAYNFYKNNILKRADILFIFLLINILLWIKNESALIGLIILLPIFLSTKKILLQKKAYFLILIAIAFFIRFILLKYYDFKIDDYQLAETTKIDLNLFLKNIKVITFYFFINIIKNPYFLLSYLFLLIFIKIFAKNFSIILYISLLHVIFIYFAFMFNLPNVEWQTRVAMDRILYSTGSFFLMLFVFLANKISSKN
jgi:hypothetical protein